MHFLRCATCCASSGGKRFAVPHVWDGCETVLASRFGPMPNTFGFAGSVGSVGVALLLHIRHRFRRNRCSRPICTCGCLGEPAALSDDTEVWVWDTVAA